MSKGTVVLHPLLPTDGKQLRTPEACLEEAVSLAEAIALDITDALIVSVHTAKPATLFGSGKVEELGTHMKALDTGLAIIDTALTPVQQRNLEKAWDCKVIDRTALILEIFGERAQTREGKLQVELAALNYQKSRLVRSWTHLERQRGSLGFVGGPGESQIELDRRMIRDRIAAIRKQLDKVVRTRDLHRKLRKEAPFPVIALAGYTNAGKSTLFNQLTNANILAEDALFATLDPTIRKVTLPSGMDMMLSDTVGFISNLPTDLVAAFRATLEEVCEADIILHVRDASHPDTVSQKQDVEKILRSLLGKEHADTPIIEVMNKMDKLEDAPAPSHGTQHFISALTGAGIDDLLAALDTLIREKIWLNCHYTLPFNAGKALAWLHSHGHIRAQEQTDEALTIDVQLSRSDASRFTSLFGFAEH